MTQLTKTVPGSQTGLRALRTRGKLRAAAVIALAALSVSVLAGCSAMTGQAETPILEAPLPESYSGALAQAADSPSGDDGWWRDLGVDELDEVVERVRVNNPTLRAASASVRAAEALARTAGAQLAPQVGLGLSTSRRKQNFIGFPIPGSEDRVLSTTATNSGLSVNVSWEADLWGRIRAGQLAALSDVEASRNDLEALHLSLIGQTVKTWISLRELELQTALSDRTLESRRETAQRVDARYRRGTASALDVRLARAQIGAVEAQLAAQEARLDLADRQLRVLAGEYPRTADRSQLVIEDGLPDLPALPDSGTPAELLRRRPDLRAAESRALAASARLREARRALYPSFTLSGTSGTATSDLEDLLDGDFSVWSLAANLLQPLFQGGRLRAGVSFAEAGLEAEEARWLELTLAAFLEVESTLTLERRLDEQVGALMDSATESQAAERLALSRYQRGLSDYLTVLESQRAAFQASSQLLTAQRQRLEARVDLILALGGGPEPPLTSTPPHTASTSSP